jgi:O-antigen/teichoic acid export membrane protein
MSAPATLRVRLGAALSGKFQRDALWNFASVGVLGLCGYGLNFLIGRFYGSAPLGVFNQVMAAYIFFSQAAVGGINLSVLRAVSENREDRSRVATIVAGSLPPTLALATLFALAFYFARHAVADLLDSPGVAEGMAAAAPGLFFFALNKVGMSVVNAAQRMRAFAIYTSLRYVLMVAGLGVAAWSGMSADRLAFLFTFAEGLLFVPLALEVARQMAAPIATNWRAWRREHLVYGIKSAGAGMLMELNSRIDVLMLGFFLADGPVGVYSFAALVAEGVFQLLVVLQNNYNPLLAQHLAAGRMKELEAVVARGKRLTYALMLGVGVATLAVFPAFLWVLEREEFAAGWVPLAFLVGGIVAISGFMPFLQTLLMANRPAWHTRLMASVVIVNIFLNAVLIPFYGLAGAAAATAVAMAWSVVALRLVVRREVGLRL